MNRLFGDGWGRMWGGVNGSGARRKGGKGVENRRRGEGEGMGGG